MVNGLYFNRTFQHLAGALQKPSQSGFTHTQTRTDKWLLPYWERWEGTGFKPATFKSFRKPSHKDGKQTLMSQYEFVEGRKHYRY